MSRVNGTVKFFNHTRGFGFIEFESNDAAQSAIDALDGSPVIDIKCFIPDKTPPDSIRVPDWVGDG